MCDFRSMGIGLSIHALKDFAICDPVQQKGHLVGQVYSEIMNKTVCKI